MKSTRKLFIYALLLLLSAGVAFPVLAFIGPSTGQTPGSGGGLFQVDANRNIGFGTSSSTPVSTFNSTSTESGSSAFGYVFTVASTTNPGLSLKNLTSGNTYVWSSRNFGNLQLYRESATLPGYVVIDVNQYGDVAIGQKATSTGGVARLYVGGNVQTTGAFVGSVSGAVGAGNVSSGVFGSLQGNGNFAFPAALAVGTTTTTGLPTEGLYVKGNVGIGTTGPQAKLTISRTSESSTLGSASALQITGVPSTTANNVGARTEINFYTNTDSLPSNLVHAGIGLIRTSAAGNETGDLYFNVSSLGGTSVERMRITSTGNVGIGTSTPASTLQVNGSVSIGTAAASALDSSANQLVIGAGAGSKGLTIYTGTASDASILFADGTTGDQTYRGRIIYSHASDKLTFNTAGTANNFVMDSSGNVGIATTTPAYTLDVAGTGRFTGQLTVPTPTAGTSAATKSYVDSVVGGGSGTGSFSTLSVSGTSTLATNANDRVGIGTTGPSQKVEIGGTRSAPATSGTTQTGILRIAQSSGGESNVLDIGNFGASPWGSWLQATERGNLAINYPLALNPNGGNVGIGTAGPGYKLEVKASAATEVGGIALRSSSTASPLVVLHDTTDDGVISLYSSATKRILLDSAPSRSSYINAGNVGIATTTPAYALTTVGTSYFSQPVIVGTPTANSHAATKSYVDSVSAGSSGVWLLSGSNLYTSSTSWNVGVGTTTPTSKLSVAGNIYSSGSILGQSSLTPNAIFLIGVNGIASDGFVEVGDNFAGRSNGIKFYPGDSSPAVTIASSSNVGVGTTSPGTKLDVAGTITSRNVLLVNTGGGATKVGSLGAANDTSGGTPSGNDLVVKSWVAGTGIAFQTSDAGQAVFIKSDGSVGIATTTPGYALTTVGTGYFSQPVIVGTPTANTHAATKSYVDSAVGSGLIGSGTANYLARWTSGTNLSTSTLYNDYTNGRIGIGTAAPGVKLEIQGGAIGAGGVLIQNGGGSIDLSFKGNQGNEYARFYEAGGTDPGYFELLDEGAVKVRLAAGASSYLMGGNVGIASSSPGYALTVAGTGYFSQPVIVGTPTQTSHAATKDYVDSAVTGGGGAGSFTTLTVSGTSTLNGNLSFGGALVTNLNANSKNITGVNKLTVTTIDPLYEIQGKKYATYAASIAGGVKEEFVGKGRLTPVSNDEFRISSKGVNDSNIQNSNNQSKLETQNSNLYQYVIDFNEIKRGSDLWVWRKAIDFSDDTVQVLATPKRVSIPVAYEIDGNKIIFRAQLPITNYQLPSTIDFSYRLIGNRFDWRDWPTLAKDQSETPSFVIK